jgi:hypothetical protein
MLAPGWFCRGSLPARKVASGPIHTPQTLRRIGCVGGCRRSLTGAQELGMQCGAGPEGSAPFAQRSRGNLIHVDAVPVRPGLPAHDCGASCSSNDFGGGWLCSHDGNRTPCSVGQGEQHPPDATTRGGAIPQGLPGLCLDARGAFAVWHS